MNNERGKYNTRQRSMILSFLIEKESKHVTAQDIAEHLKGMVGQTTIYRRLEELVNEGAVIKYDIPNGSGACYRYIGNGTSGCNQCHFLCVDCGQMLHLSCDRLASLTEHVQAEHSIRLDMQKTVLYGSCELCGGIRLRHGKEVK